MSKSKNSNYFPAGKYYIGDPCYAVKDGKWIELVETTGCFGLHNKFEIPYDNWNDGLFLYNGKKCFAEGTAYWVGSYQDNKGRIYGVDAGLIGIMPLECCDGNLMDGGNIVEFEKPFYVSANNGVFEFGNVIINTRDDEDNDTDDEDYESED